MFSFCFNLILSGIDWLVVVMAGYYNKNVFQKCKKKNAVTLFIMFVVLGFHLHLRLQKQISVSLWGLFILLFDAIIITLLVYFMLYIWHSQEWFIKFGVFFFFTNLAFPYFLEQKICPKCNLKKEEFMRT